MSEIKFTEQQEDASHVKRTDGGKIPFLFFCVFALARSSPLQRGFFIRDQYVIKL